MPIHDLTGAGLGNSVNGELAVVMPIYNEAAMIALVLREWREVLNSLKIAPTFILIDDGSKDGTAELLKKLDQENDGMLVIRKPNSGHGRSCRLGYDIASASRVEWVLQIDSDGQCDPLYFAEFWNQRKDFDCIFGIRRRRDDGRARAFFSQVCRWSASLVAGQDLVDPNVPYRLIRRACLQEAIARIPQGFDIHNMALTLVLKNRESLKWKYVDIHFKERSAGQNSINLMGVVQLGFSMLFDLMKLRTRLKNQPGS